MKKIMFNDKYGLTEAVLSGHKIMTRRIIKGDFEKVKSYHANGGWHFIADTKDGDSVEVKPAYEIGEKVAVAQSYQTLIEQGYLADDRKDGWVNEKYITSPGYSNKMFVSADFMPHRIRITDIKVERLQDISEEDAMKEGVEKWMDGFIVTGIMEHHGQNNAWFKSPRDAFFRLFTKLCGYKAWNTNPWVYAYTFELVR